jgi:outer membrane immunogenic protein
MEGEMHRLLIVGSALAALISAPAFAADMPLKAPPPPAPPAYTWTGFYLEGGLGYGAWSADRTILAGPFGATPGSCIVCQPVTEGGKGWLGTIGGGYDYQFTDHIVAGLLADWAFSNINGSIEDPVVPAGGLVGNLKEEWSWASGARIGWLLTPTVLTYINGGYTETHFNSASLSFEAVSILTSSFSTPAFNLNGWFLGGGMEASLANIVPGLFARLEYRYASYGTANLLESCPPIAPGALGCHGSGALLFAQDVIAFRPSVQTVSAALVYKFNWFR